MLKGLLFLIVLMFIFIAIIVMIVVRYIFIFIKNVKKMRQETFDDEDLHDYSRKRRQQYSYGGRTSNTWEGRASKGAANDYARQKASNASGSSYSGNGYSQSGSSSAESSADASSGKEVLIDMRDPIKKEQKIIDSDEGEYVDFKCD